jgi:DNA-binding transcriptional LysR family regulator
MQPKAWAFRREGPQRQSGSWKTMSAPLLGVGRYLESGALVEIIPDFRRRALAVSLVVAHRRNLSRRVRAFMKWIENVLAPYME